MGPAARSRLAAILRWALTIGALTLVVYLLSREDWRAILQDARSLLGWPLVIAVGLLGASRVFTGLRWHQLVASSDIPISLSDSMRVTFAGLFSTNFLPSTVGGDVVRLGGGISLGLSASFTAATLIMDRLLGMLGMSFFAPIGAYAILPNMASAALAQAAQSAAPVGLIPRLWQRGQGFLSRLWQALKLWVHKPGVLLRAEVFNLLHLACMFGCMYTLLHATGETISYWLIAGLWSFVYFITLVPITVNGFGLQEVSITFIFVKFGGVSDADALLFALAFRLLMMLLSLPGALFVGDLAERAIQSPLETANDQT